MTNDIRSYSVDNAANKNGLNGASISANLSKWEAARSSFFVFKVDDLNGISRAAYGGKDEAIPDAENSIMLAVTQCDVPSFSLQRLEYRRGNDVITFAGTPSFGSGSLTIDDVIGLETKNILLAWKGLCYNVKTRKGGRMADYKKTCTLCEYTQDYELIRTWTLYGCWISDTPEDAFNKEADGKRAIRAKIEYDRAEPSD